MKQVEKYFDTAFGAPDGVKKLRELILTLAFQGKLLPVKSKLQPASDLIATIKSARKISKISKKTKDLSPSTGIDKIVGPYDLPFGWEWVQLRDISRDLGQKRPDSQFTYIDVGAIDNKNGKISGLVQTIDSKVAPSRARKIVKEGTIIYSTVRPYLLNIAIVEKLYKPEPIASTAFAILHTYPGINNRYVYYYLRSPVFISYVESLMKGVAYPAINDGDFFDGLIPLPPTIEQNEIVGKIDQFLSRCDELEKLRADRDQTRLAVHTAAIRKLLDAPDQRTFDDAWQFITRHFGDLYTVRKNVAELRKAILQLAVMGKLVPQDPKEGTARELLEEIERENRKMVREGKMKEPKPIPPIKPAEIPFKVPKGWEWVRLRTIVYDLGQKTPKSNFTYIDVGSIDNINGVIGESVQQLQSDEAPSRARKIVKKDTVIYSTVRPYLMNIAIVEKQYEPQAIASTAFAILHPFIGINNRYLYYYLRSPTFIVYVENLMKGVAYPAINDGDFFMGLIPLPPATEQNQIVATIVKLTNLCAKLENHNEKVRNKKNELLEAVLTYNLLPSGK